MKRVAIVAGARTPFVKSFGAYSKLTMKDLLSFVLYQLKERHDLTMPLGEVVAGGVSKHASDWNLTREALLLAGIHPNTPAQDLQKACGTSLEAAITVANKIKLGQIEIGIAAGVDTNSDAPVSFSRNFSRKLIGLSQARTMGARLGILSQFRPSDLKPVAPSIQEPRTGLSMGQHCEKMAQEWQIARADQDELAASSHHKAAAAWKEGFFDDLVHVHAGVKSDAITRGDTSVEKLAKLRSAFAKDGTLTAGNSTPLTDGAAAVLLASEEYAKKHGLPILGYFGDAQSAAVDFVAGAGLLMAPTLAVSELLKRNDLGLDSFAYYEIHEAFAAQVLCTLKAWEDPKYCKDVLGRDEVLGPIDRSKMNVKGGSLATGHPFGATGARIVPTLAKLMQQRPGEKGLISICTAGGMGVAAIIEGA